MFFTLILSPDLDKVQPFIIFNAPMPRESVNTLPSSLNATDTGSSVVRHSAVAHVPFLNASFQILVPSSGNVPELDLDHHDAKERTGAWSSSSAQVAMGHSSTSSRRLEPPPIGNVSIPSPKFLDLSRADVHEEQLPIALNTFTFRYALAAPLVC
ncbi:hypothetical protein FB107DRAFT_210876 [Schizophyllum commune]